MTHDDLIIIIPTHGRPNAQKTLETLIEAKCSYPILLLVDSEDSTKDEYLEKYGEQVVIFDKERDKIDLFDNDVATNTVTFAREKAREIAKGLGYKYVFEMDDDITRISLRYPDEGKLRGMKLLEVDPIIDLLHMFMEAGCGAAGLGQGGGLIGGMKSQGIKDGLTPRVAGAFVIGTEGDVKFRSRMDEDAEIGFNLWNIGKPVFTMPTVIIQSPTRGTNDGGLAEEYKRIGEWKRAFYVVLSHPDNSKMRPDCKRADNISNRPKILNERWRK